MKHRKKDAESYSLCVRDQIIESAFQHFSTKGYYGTSIRAIARPTSAAEGAVYYYFKSKADLYTTLVNQITKECEQEIWSVAYKKNNHLSHDNEFLNFIGNILHYFTQKPYTVGIIVLGIESTHFEKAVGSAIQQHFKEWAKAFKALYTKRYSDSQANEMAQRALMLLQGALVLSSTFTNEKKEWIQQLERGLSSLSVLNKELLHGQSLNNNYPFYQK